MKRCRALVVALSLGAVAASCSKTAPPVALPSLSPTQASPDASVTPLPSRSPHPSPQLVETFRPTPHLIDNGPRTRKVVALTFDADMTDGMLQELRSGQVDSWYNEDVIKELRKTHTPATLFLTGQWAKTYPAQTKSFARDPLFELGNHSWDHSAWTSDCYNLPYITGASAKRAEVQDSADEIERLTGVTPQWFRFPGGCHSAADPRFVANLGEQSIGWDVVSGDAFATDADAVAQAVIDRAKPGSIVVMHMHGGPNAPVTAPALRQIIPALKARGFGFVTLSELLGR